MEEDLPGLLGREILPKNSEEEPFAQFTRIQAGMFGQNARDRERLGVVKHPAAHLQAARARKGPKTLLELKENNGRGIFHLITDPVSMYGMPLSSKR